jgi:enediyne biosynthesis protein E4
LNTVRGFESTVEQTLHFGLGKVEMVDSLMITWADGKETLLTHVKADTLLKIDYNAAKFYLPKSNTEKTTTFFEEISSDKLGIDYVDNHIVFNDFNYERLLPRKYSENGQGIAVGDVNKDGLEDFFIGGGFQRTGKIYIQNINGKFSGKPLSTINDGCLDAGALFFDADNDNDLDLYVVSGGNQFTHENEKYQDRLYLNNGKGEFKIDVSGLPKMIASGSCITATDFDKDGDLDLFVGGGIKPGFYPKNSNSYLLQNNKGRFTDVTNAIASGLQNIGIVTSGLFTDIDNDNLLDLVVCGEYMPITIYKNKGGKFENITSKTSLNNSDGWWQSITPGDFDNDEDIDYVAGNWGLNSPYLTSSEQPMTLFNDDFDNNGTIDPILCYYQENVLYPSAPLDYMVEHIPFLKKKFLHYIDYAKAPSDKILEMFDKKASSTLYCKTLTSVYIENKGNFKFEIHPLPQQAQMAPLFGMSATDVNNDGNLDLIGVGNFYHTDVTVGQYDAQKGLTLLGDGRGNFKPTTLKQSGFIVDTDAKALARIETNNNKSLYLVSQIYKPMGVYAAKSNDGLKRINPTPKEISAIIELENGRKRKMEFNSTNGYLSQSSSTFALNNKIKKILFRDLNGKNVREVSN